MAIAKVADRGSTQNLTAEGATIVTVTGTVAVGNVLIARIAVDNSGGGGAAPGLSVSGSAGNTWVVVGPALQDPGAASAGIATYLCYAVITNQLVNGNTISFDWTGSPTAKSIVVEEWSGIDTTTPVAVAAVTANGATTTPSRTTVPTAAGQLVYMVLGIEGPAGDTYTVDSDTLNGSWVTLTNLSTTSGTAASNATVRGQYKLVTASGTQTWNPTITARDWAALGVVFAVAPVVVPKAGSDSISISLTESVVVTGLGPILSEGFESPTLSINVVSGSWARTTAKARTGTYSFTNPDIADSQTADVVVTIPNGATQMDLYYIVSSEATWDFFRILLDAVQVFEISGNTVSTWTAVSLDVTGKSQVTFRYFKDSSQSVGDDAAYIDDLVFSGPVAIGPPPEPKAGSDNVGVSFTEVGSILAAYPQQLFPDAILTQTNLTGTVADIDEDPDSPDANWLVGGGAVTLRVSFPAPTTDLVPTFAQEFRVRTKPGT